jgi:transposase InsO family protein
VAHDPGTAFGVRVRSLNHESATLAKRLPANLHVTGIERDVLMLHQDRGAPLASGTCANLDIDRSHSSPRISNDNPLAESQFKTMKYQPDFRDYFDVAQRRTATTSCVLVQRVVMGIVSSCERRRANVRC